MVNLDTALSPGLFCAPPSVQQLRVSWWGVRDDESAVERLFFRRARVLPATDTLDGAPDPRAAERGARLEHALHDGSSGLWDAWEELESTTRELVLPTPTPPNASGGTESAAFYYAVRACNGVGLCTTSNVSRGVRRVDSPPVGGQVLLRGGQVGSDGFAGGLDLPLTGS